MSSTYLSVSLHRLHPSSREWQSVRVWDQSGVCQLTAGLALAVSSSSSGPNTDSVTSHCHGLRHPSYPPCSWLTLFFCHMLLEASCRQGLLSRHFASVECDGALRWGLTQETSGICDVSWARLAVSWGGQQASASGLTSAWAKYTIVSKENNISRKRRGNANLGDPRGFRGATQSGCLTWVPSSHNLNILCFWNIFEKPFRPNEQK